MRRCTRNENTSGPDVATTMRTGFTKRRARCSQRGSRAAEEEQQRADRLAEPRERCIDRGVAHEAPEQSHGRQVAQRLRELVDRQRRKLRLDDLEATINEHDDGDVIAERDPKPAVRATVFATPT